MKEPFFADINWTKLEKKQLDPPTVLCKQKNSKEETGVIHAAGLQSHNDEMAMLFEAPESHMHEDREGFDDEQRGGGQRVLLSDQDYTEENRTYNRVKNYSFART